MFSERILSKYLQFTSDRYFSTISKVNGYSLPNPQPNKSYLLYAHVPFCESLCPYCSFNRFVFNENSARSYFINLRQEMEMVAQHDYQFNALYLGGGTPTILIDELIKTIELARHLFGIKEVSCETNPNQLTSETGEFIRGYVQRLSVGVQSFNDVLLKEMKRYDKFGSGQEILERINSFSDYVPTLNVDLIFNFPHQTNEMLLEDIRAVINSNADQVTYYPLMTSPSVNKVMKRVFGNISYSQEAIQYFLLQDTLGEDFTPSSAWTYSRKSGGLIDEYIVDYDEYVGIGSGSFSFLNGDLLINTFSTKEYCNYISRGLNPIVGIRKFNLTERMQYRFLMDLFGLRLEKKVFMEEFNIPVEKGLWKEVLFLRNSQAFSQDDNDVFLVTPKGRYLLVAMMREFFSGINKIRDLARSNLPVDEKLLTI